MIYEDIWFDCVFSCSQRIAVANKFLQMTQWWSDGDAHHELKCTGMTAVILELTLNGIKRKQEMNTAAVS